MEIFTVRDLSERTEDIIRGAEEGKLSVITKRGTPVFIALPFDEVLVREGVAVALAVHLFTEAQISLGKAAQLADMARSDFTQYLGKLGISVIQTTQSQLEQELAAFDE